MKDPGQPEHYFSIKINVFYAKFENMSGWAALTIQNTQLVHRQNETITKKKQKNNSTRKKHYLLLAANFCRLLICSAFFCACRQN